MKGLLITAASLTALGVSTAFAAETAREVRSTPISVSLSRYLQLRPNQIQRLDALYKGYAVRRRDQEAKILGWQSKLTVAQAPTSFNAKQVTSLQRDINTAQQKVVDDFLSCRGKALEVLPPVQRSQLQALATDSRFSVRQDAYYELLLMPVERVWDLPVIPSSEKFGAVQGDKSKSGFNPRIGVYSGYGYGGPQYGVGVGAGKGPVGVHAGIGRGGPSFGIGIGGIFSGRHW